METNTRKNRRILVVDDNDAIHADFSKILEARRDTSELDDLEASIFGARPKMSSVQFEVSFASQGVDALDKVKIARDRNAPFALVFVDMRMPPGWDGIETLTRLWQEDPLLQAVLCSAYSDYAWSDITAKFGVTDRLLVLKKPFEPIEVRQMACALTEKWNQHVWSASVESELRRSEAKNRGIIEALPDTLLIVGRDGICRDYKTGRHALWPAQPGFSPGGALHEVLSPEAAKTVMPSITLALDTGVTQVLEIQHDDAAEVRVLEVRVASIEGDDALVLLRDVTEQKRRNEALEQQRAREEAVRLQAEALLSLATPLIPITDDIMVVPLVGELDPSRMGRVREALSEGISTRGARIAILDMTGVPGITPAVAEEIVRVAQAARLLGSQMILTGIRSDVAQTLVALGQGLGNIATHRTLQSGIAFALAKR